MGNVLMMADVGFQILSENVSITLRSRDYKSAPVVLYEEDPSVFSVEGNGMRPSHLGVGISDANAPMYTLNTTEVHAVMYEEQT